MNRYPQNHGKESFIVTSSGIDGCVYDGRSILHRTVLCVGVTMDIVCVCVREAVFVISMPEVGEIVRGPIR